MTATRLDGKATAGAIRTELAERVAALTAAGRRPGLGTLLVGDDPGSRWYVNAKHSDCAQVGIASIQRELPADASQADVLAVVAELNADPACTGYIVQLPLPRQVSEAAVLEAMDPDKDADGLHPTNLGRLVLGVPGPLPCTPLGIVELLRRYDVPLAGAEVVVVGRGVTVGRPLGLLLTRRSENATVTLCHTGTRDLAAHTRAADVVVAAAGVPGLITADMVRPGGRRARRRREPGRRQDRRGRRRRRGRGRRARRPQPRRRGPDDPGDAAEQRGHPGRAGRRPRRGLRRPTWPAPRSTPAGRSWPGCSGSCR